MICRTWLKAVRANAARRTLDKLRGSAVLGDALGYTVELQDGSQIYVGRQCCKYCARAEAHTVVDRRLALGQPLCDYAPRVGGAS